MQTIQQRTMRIILKLRTTLRSQTHLQATQANAKTQACRRECMPNRTTDRPATDKKEQRSHNNTYPKVAA